MWEKISDYCLDVSKYFLTAVFVASLMVDLGEMRWLLYAISGVLATIFFLQVCSSYPKVRMRKKGSIKQLESITIKIGGHKMDALFFLGVVTVLFGIVFAVLLSPKGQKWVNKYS